MHNFGYEDYLDFKHEVDKNEKIRELIEVNAPCFCQECEHIDAIPYLGDAEVICQLIDDNPPIEQADCPLEKELI